MSSEEPLRKYERCEAHSSHVGAPLRPATYIRYAGSGWHVVVYDDEPRQAYYASEARRLAPRKVTPLQAT